MANLLFRKVLVFCILQVAIYAIALTCLFVWLYVSNPIRWDCQADGKSVIVHDLFLDAFIFDSKHESFSCRKLEG